VTAWGLTGGGGPDASAHSSTGTPGTGGVAVGAADGCGAADGGTVGVMVAGPLGLDTGTKGVAGCDAGADDAGDVGVVGEPESVAGAGAAAPELLDEQAANPMVTKTITPRVVVRMAFTPRTFVIVLPRHRSQNEPHTSTTRILGRGSGLFQARFASYDPKGQGEKS
jgi:hypothetical protein